MPCRGLKRCRLKKSRIVAAGSLDFFESMSGPSLNPDNSHGGRMEAKTLGVHRRGEGISMTNILRRWTGASVVVSALTLAAGAAQGQDIQGDFWQYQRD